ncbi:hypothetical protein BKA63DRAFT_88377 [Paraphoma chrysanthemicola]|nr:hypothetical protein BKA63DRAFT_88377 [Paraphoma chrysanthemicola]
MSLIRTSLPVATQPWEAAKARFLEGLPAHQAARFESASLENIFYDASIAQKKHTQASRSWHHQERLSSFFDSVNEYGKAMDVYSNTYGLIISPIWGSLRVVIHIATEAGKFQDSIVEMLAQIGDVLPRFQIYQMIFKNHERLLVVLADVFLDVLNFCVLTKDFFLQAKKSLIPLCIVLKGAWKPFRRQFDVYMIAFRNHCKRVEKEAHMAHMIESARDREVQRANQALQIRNEKHQRRYRALAAIPAVDYQAKHAKFLSLRHPGTNAWILGAAAYMTWEAKTNSDCLCYYGIPGSGKSVLSASVINDASMSTSQSKSAIIYYYFDYADADSLDSYRLLGSLVRQCLALASLDLFSDSFACPYLEFGSRLALQTCLDYLLSLVRGFDVVTIVLDGLDQLEDNSQVVILELLTKVLRDPRCLVKVFVTSRPEEPLIKRTLKAYQTVSASKQLTNDDIASFIEVEMDMLRLHNPLLEDARLRQEVVEALLTGADTM